MTSDGLRYNRTAFLPELKFDDYVTYNYYRIGYDYVGYSFVNYGHYSDPARYPRNYVDSSANYRTRFSFDSVYIESTDTVCLYGTSIANINSVGSREVLGDGFAAGKKVSEFLTESHYITVYVGWEAKEYTINISLNNNDTARFNNYGNNDAGYALVFGSLDPVRLDNNAILAYVGDSSTLVKYKVKFDDMLPTAITYYASQPFTLNGFKINLTGYTYQTLNTHFNSQYYAGENSNNTTVVKNGVCQEIQLNKTLFGMLYYQQVVGEGITVQKELSDSILITNATISVNSISFYGDASIQDTFTLFAGYSINQYNVTVKNDSSSPVDGVYSMINNENVSLDFTTEKSQNLKFYTTEYIIATTRGFEDPAERANRQGYFLSKMQIYFTSSYNGARYRFDLYLEFNSAKRITEIKTFAVYVYNAQSGQYTSVATGTVSTDPLKYHLSYAYITELDREDYRYTSESYPASVPVNERDVKIAIDYVFNSIKVTPVAYGQTVIPEVAGRTDISYSLMPQDTAYSIIQIDNVKSNLEIVCSYALQTFDVAVEIIISDGTAESDSTQNIAETKPFTYGTIISDVTSVWDTRLSASFEHTGWYKVNIIGDQASETVLEDFTTLINENLTLKSYYKLSSSDKTKKVVFYHWSGEEDGHYVEYANNENYVLQGIKMYLSEDKTTYITEHLGYQYENGEWTWVNGSQGFNYFVIDANAHVTGENGPKIEYGRLKQIPSINSWYPDSQFICYVAFTNEHLDEINDLCGTNYIYFNQITEQNVYFRVTNYYSDGTVDIVMEGAVDAGGNPINVELEGVPVLSTTTPISQTIYAVQTYAIMNFTIEDESDFRLSNVSGSGNSYEGTLTIDVQDYLDTVTFFEVLNNTVVYYAKDTEKVKMITLNQTEYDAYLYSRAAGATPETALYNVISKYKRGSDPLASFVKELDPSQATYTQAIKSNEYVFLFYYKKGTTTDIITVCDTYFTAQTTDFGGVQTALEFYPTSNNVRFNADTISVSRTETETTVDINRENMRSSFVDKNGIVYGTNDLRFAVLNDVELNEFLTLVQNNTNKETTLYNVMNTAIADTRFEIDGDVYIFAFYYKKNADGSTDTSVIARMACNYIYINFETTTNRLIYISDLMFTSTLVDYLMDESYTYPTNETGYDVKVDYNKMFTTMTDYSTGTQYDTANLRLIAFSGSQMRLFADDVMNGISHVDDHGEVQNMTAALALQIALARTDGYTAISTTDQVGMLTFGVKYYILAYFVDGSGNVAGVSVNMLEVFHSEELTDVKLTTLANALGFTIKSISTTKTSATTADISINTNYINKTFMDYASQVQVDESRIRYIHLTRGEVDAIKQYYIDSRTSHTDPDTHETYLGLRIKYGGNQRDFRNLSLEQAFELVIYYYRNLTNTNSNPFKDQLVNNTDSLDKIIAGGYLPTSLYPISSTTYKIDTSTDEVEMNGVTGMYDHYMIAFVINPDGVTVDKVASNYLHIEYAKSGSTITTINTSVITLETLIYG